MKAPALAGDAKVAGMSDADVAAAIKANPRPARDPKKLKDDDIAAVAGYVKGLPATRGRRDGTWPGSNRTTDSCPASKPGCRRRDGTI